MAEQHSIINVFYNLKSCGTFSRAGSTPALSTTSEQAMYCLLRFLFTKIRAWQCAAALPFLQKARSARLFACKHAHDGSPASVPLAQIPIVSEKFI